ncbi:MAG: AraC family transcriptional regulator [Methylovirgula sp.]|uniref:AraC family transcriptional regulator n=1 Tax=Methylovirgula sp. TaxID=1978224 RepID=UPI0030767469
MDPLSDVLSLLKPRSYMFGGFDLGGDWSFHFAQPDAIKCYAAVSGRCWLAVEGIPDAVRVEAGDCVLLPHERPFRIASDLTLPPIDSSAVFPSQLDGSIVSYNGGGDCFAVGGHFTLSGGHADALLGILPPLVHIRKQSDGAALRWSVERMMKELRDPQPGGYLIAQYLAYMMLVQALRLHLAEGSNRSVGWLFALADKRMSAAITAMHSDPANRWTLQSLARCAGMSRTSFTLKFKEAVGLSPMDYLTRWRMLRAADRLRNSDESVSVISRSVGYESESAFSAAFRRVMGCSPRQYGHTPGH